MHTNTKKLRALMKRHNLNSADVAKVLGREVNTVRIWRMKETPRVIPNDTLKLLDMLVAAGGLRGTAA